MWRRLVVTSIGCALIAVFLWLLVPSLGRSGFFPVLVHSELIGLCIATLSIVAQRRLLSESPSRLAFTSVHVASSLLGLAIGQILARLVLGLPLIGASWLDAGDALLATGVTTLAASFGFVAHFRSRARLADLARQAAEASRRADSARLSMLRAQLDPHMLFNTLANLRALIATDPHRAQAMVDHLVPFLRATLDGSREDTWTLAQEFDELRHYLEIMSIRLGSRLTFDLELAGSVRDVRLPALLLQPLVENAVRHGIEPSVSGGRIDVLAEPSGGGDVLITVCDRCGASGGRAGSRDRQGDFKPAPGSPFGLDNVRDRLRLLHGDAASLTIDAGPRVETDAVHDGTQVTIRMPMHGSTSTSPSPHLPGAPTA